jgi:uncharacterized protein YciI
MFFIVSGRDRPGNIERRIKFRTQHRAHYEALGEDLLLSGPYLDEKGDPVGSMIIMRRDSQAEADAFANVDPYVLEGVFETLSVARWEWFMNRPAGLAP